MLIAAEQEFRQNMDDGKHEYDLKQENMCPYHLSSIAYWFAVVESWLWWSNVAHKTNNRFSMKIGSGKYQYVRQDERGKMKYGKYMKYPSPFLSTVDFMYLFKYAYYCKLSMVNISMYKLWTVKNDANTQRYYNSLIGSIKYFEKKYFGDWKTLDDYNLYKEPEKKEPTISKINFSTNQSKNISTLETQSPYTKIFSNQTAPKTVKISATVDIQTEYKNLNKLLWWEIKIQKSWNETILIWKNGKKYTLKKKNKLTTSSLDKNNSTSKNIELTNAKTFNNQTGIYLWDTRVFSNQNNISTSNSKTSSIQVKNTSSEIQTFSNQSSTKIINESQDKESSKALNIWKSNDFLSTLEQEDLDDQYTGTNNQEELYKEKMEKDLKKMNLNYETFLKLVEWSEQTWNKVSLNNSEINLNISGS